MRGYARDFYRLRHDRTLYAARTVLALLMQNLPTIRSAVDVGCGVGTWLSVLKEMGANTIQGLDGTWVDESWLVIDRDCFSHVDLSRPIPISRRYDLAISMEVAEHLPAGRAHGFVDALTGFSDFVLFSAAIPGQGGVGHVNEQWQQYWVDLFAQRNYALFDLVRPGIWDDPKIAFWYRQNALLFVARSAAHLVKCGTDELRIARFPVNVVHPDQFAQEVKYRSTVPGSLRILRGAIRRALFRRGA